MRLNTSIRLACGHHSLWQGADTARYAILIKISAKCQRAVRIVNRNYDFVDSEWLRAAILEEQIKIEPLLRASGFDVGFLRLDAYGNDLILTGRAHTLMPEMVSSTTRAHALQITRITA